jgi:hypothetical protein
MRTPIPLRPDRELFDQRAVTSIVRAAIATAVTQRGAAHGYIRGNWADDTDALHLVERAATTPASLTNTTALAQVAASFLAVLAPVSAAASLLQRGVQLSFDGAAQIRLPTVAPGIATFVQEGKAIPVRSFVSAGNTIEPRKLATIIELTNEMLRSSNAEALVRQALIETCARGLDAVLFDDQPEDAIRPAGLRNGVAGTTPATGGPGHFDEMVADILALGNAITTPGPVVFIAAKNQFNATRLLGSKEFPFSALRSDALATGMIIAVAVDALAVVFDPPTIDSGGMSVIHEETGPATDIGGVIAAPLRSSFQSDTVAIRVRQPVTWQLRTTGAVAWMTGTAW